METCLLNTIREWLCTKILLLLLISEFLFTKSRKKRRVKEDKTNKRNKKSQYLNF